jgi:purine nucleosidase
MVDRAPLPVLLDVDTGIDDALALLYAHLSPEIDLVGVTTCFGNGDLSVTTRNTLSVLELVGSDAPVYAGAATPLSDWTGAPAEAFHGQNGLGGAVIPDPTRGPEKEAAAQYLVRMVNARPGELTLVAVARLTNVAVALSLDPALLGKLRGLYVMGGAAFVPGNVTAAAEANIWGDPEAAYKVFHAGGDITMVGLDVTHQALFTDDDLAGVEPHWPYAGLLRDALEFYLAAYNPKRPQGTRTAPLHDPLAVMLAETPDLARGERYAVSVERAGVLTRGATVVDARPYSPEVKNVQVALELDIPRFRRRFLTRLGWRTA